MSGGFVMYCAMCQKPTERKNGKAPVERCPSCGFYGVTWTNVPRLAA